MGWSRRVGSLLLAGALVACAERQVVPTLRHAAAARTIQLAGAGASSYGVASVAAQELPAAEQALRQAIVQAGGGDVPLDPRLSAAATQVAEWVPRHGRLAYAAVELAIHHHGVVEPTPAMVLLWSSPATSDALVEPLVEQLRPLVTAHPYRAAGIGQVRRESGEDATVALLLESSLVIAPVPRHLPSHGAAKLTVTVEPGFARTEVFVTHPDGSVAENIIDVPAGKPWARRFACAVDGEHRVEIVGSDARGPVVLANFPIYCGVDVPHTLTLAATSAVHHPAEAEAALLEAINGERRRANLPQLAVHADAAGVARAWAAQMAATGQVVHETAAAGSALDRLRAAGVRVPVVRENLARAGDVDEAHAGLMASPGHRANILSASATHVGVGVAVRPAGDGAELFVTELFVRVPPPVDAREARAVITGRLRAAGLRHADELDPVAEAQAVAMVAGKAHAAAASQSTAGIDARRYARLRSLSVGLGDVGEFDATPAMADPTFRDFGVGIAQGEHPELGAGAIYVVVVLGARRS